MLDDLDARPGEIREIDDGLTLERIGEIREPNEEPEDGQALVFGNPEAPPPAWRAALWEEDGALACCARALEYEKSRETIRQDALESGLFLPRCGVSLDDLPCLMEAYGDGRAVEQLHDASISDLGALLTDCSCVICTVSACLLEEPGQPLWPGLDADCAVIVTALNMDDPLNVRVMLLHAERSQPEMDVPLDVFMAAWQAGGRCAFGLG